MRYLSVCSGIEAATVAWHPLGWQPVGFAEIEKHPSAVLAHHYPHVPNFGDMTKFKEWPDADVDVLVGGTPCQSFSVAGLRKGMADPRGNLALTYLAIADRYRPEWLLWENVPGVLSSNGGRDFGAILGGMVELGYGVSYRVLDAQYVRVDGFGRAVPQRRRRVFVVGNSRDWRRAAAVLFERESLSGNSAPRRQAGKGFAADIAPSIVSSGRGTERAGDTRGQDPVIATLRGISDYGNGLPSLRAEGGDCGGGSESLVAHSLRGEGFDASEDGTGRGTPLVPIHFQGRGSNIDVGQDVAGTLSQNTDRASGGAPCIAFDTTQITSKANRSVPKAGDPCHPLAAGAHPPAIAFAQNSRDEVRLFGGDGGIVGALAAEPGMKQTSYIAHAIQAGALRENPDSGPDGVGVQADHAYTLEARAEVQAVQAGWAVRRLTPTECERLQGFPDGYTNVPWRGKESSPDGPRYKDLGNSMAINCMRWIGGRIQFIDNLAALRSPAEPAGASRPGSSVIGGGAS